VAGTESGSTTAAAAGDGWAGDVLGANGILMDAYNTEVRGMVRELRADRGLDPEPMKAYAASGYAQRISEERVGGAQAGWGA
jgi:L-rhamnose isomerase/sugar isomerase